MLYSVSPYLKLRIVGIEAELKLEHADAHALCREEVTKLVHEHEHAEHEDERQNVNRVCQLGTSDLQFYPAGQLLRILAGPLIHIAHACKRRHLSRLMRIHRLLDDMRNRREIQGGPRGNARRRFRSRRSARPADCVQPRARDTRDGGTETPSCRAPRSRAVPRPQGRAAAAAPPTAPDTRTHTESATACPSRRAAR